MDFPGAWNCCIGMIHSAIRNTQLKKEKSKKEYCVIIKSYIMTNPIVTLGGVRRLPEISENPLFVKFLQHQEVKVHSSVSTPFEYLLRIMMLDLFFFFFSIYV